MVAKRHLPGRQEMSEWLDGWISRYVGDPFALTADQLYMLIGSNLGWYWNVDDIGRAPSPGYGPEGSAIAGLYKFLEETMAAKKAARERGR